MYIFTRMKKILINSSIEQKGLKMVNKTTAKIERINIVAVFAITYTAGKIIDRVLG